MIETRRKPIVLLLAILLVAPLVTPIGNLDSNKTVDAASLSSTESSSLSLLNATRFPITKHFLHPNDSIWIPFREDATPGTAPRISLISSDQEKLMIGASFYGMWNWSEQILGVDCNGIEIPFIGTLTDNGYPELPTITRFVEIPHDVNVQVSLRQDKSNLTALNGSYYVKHYLGPWYPNFTLPNATANAVVYSTNSFFPADVIGSAGASASDPIFFRGRRLMAVNLIPVQFNPVQQKLQAYTEMVVELKFDSPATFTPIDLELESKYYTELFRRILLNNRPSVSATLRASTKGYSYSSDTSIGDYLIITIEDFKDEVKPLRDWKLKTGFRTEIITVEELLTRNGLIASEENNRSVITKFINDSYWQVDGAKPPDYVLLVGDANHIPPHYESEHTHEDHRLTLIGTDLFYFTVEGPDFLPDIYYGRLSVNTSEDLENMIAKICAYEMSPPTDDAFYSISSIYYHIDSEGGTEREENLESRMTDCNVDFEHLTTGSGIKTAFEDGRFLAYYIGHGGSFNFRNEYGGTSTFEGWYSPIYTTSHLTELESYGSNEYPVVISLSCQTGWYDGETDKNVENGYYINLEDHDFDCFCENITRMAGSGAVAAIGSSRNADFNYMGQMFLGFLDGLYPDIEPIMADSHIPSLGQLLAYGKYYLIQVYDYGYYDPYPSWSKPSACRTNETYQMFQIFGDPEMTLHTQQPLSLDVDYPTTIGSGGLQSFVVTVKDFMTQVPVEDAKVSLQMGEEILRVQYTTIQGHAFFDIIPETGGLMNITVTKQNHIPYQGSIVVTPDGAVISVNPSSGEAGQYVYLYGSGFSPNYIRLNVEFGEVTIIPYYCPVTGPDDNDPTVGIFGPHELEVPEGDKEPLNILVQEPLGPAAVTVFNRYEPGVCDPYLYSQHALRISTSQQEEGELIRWDNPDIWIIRSELPRLYMIYTNIHNHGPEYAREVSVIFEWSPLGVGQTQGDWTYISKWVIPSIAPNDFSSAVSRVFAPHTSFISVQVRVICETDSNIANNVGIESVHSITVFTPSSHQDIISIDIYDAENRPELYQTLITDVPVDELIKLEIEGPFSSTPDTANIIVFIDAFAKIQEARQYVITAKYANEVVGGFELILMRGIPPPFPWHLVILVVIILLIIICTIIVYWKYYREDQDEPKPTPPAPRD